MTLKTNRETKGAETSDELTPAEIAYVRDQAKRKSGEWPRVVPFGADAVNAVTTSDLVAKTPRHLKLEIEAEACERRLKDAMRLVYEQERAAVATDSNGPRNTEYTTFVAPANEDRIEAEAALQSVRTRLNREDRMYRERQRRAILNIPEPGIIERAARALGLD